MHLILFVVLPVFLSYLQDDGSGGSNAEESGSDASDSDNDDKPGNTTVDEEDEEAEWERFQRKLNKSVLLNSPVIRCISFFFLIKGVRRFWKARVACRTQFIVLTSPTTSKSFGGLTLLIVNPTPSSLLRTMSHH